MVVIQYIFTLCQSARTQAYKYIYFLSILPRFYDVLQVQFPLRRIPSFREIKKLRWRYGFCLIKKINKLSEFYISTRATKHNHELLIIGY